MSLSVASSFSNYIQNNLPTVKLDTATNMVAKITKLAVPTILMFGFVEQAEALGCWGCGMCLATGVSLPACSIPCALCIITTTVPLG